MDEQCYIGPLAEKHYSSRLLGPAVCTVLVTGPYVVNGADEGAPTSSWS